MLSLFFLCGLFIFLGTALLAVTFAAVGNKALWP
jgi:hypothetical protein